MRLTLLPLHVYEVRSICCLTLDFMCVDGGAGCADYVCAETLL